MKLKYIVNKVSQEIIDINIKKNFDSNFNIKNLLNLIIRNYFKEIKNNNSIELFKKKRILKLIIRIILNFFLNMNNIEEFEIYETINFPVNYIHKRLNISSKLV